MVSTNSIPVTGLVVKIRGKIVDTERPSTNFRDNNTDMTWYKILVTFMVNALRELLHRYIT